MKPNLKYVYGFGKVLKKMNEKVVPLRGRIHDPVRILIVDDDATMARRLSDFANVSNLKDEVRLFSELDPSQASEAIIRWHPDVILLDQLMMPKMNGLDLLQHLKSDVSIQLPPVILLTKLSDIRAEAMAAGVSDYMVKHESTLKQILARARFWGNKKWPTKFASSNSIGVPRTIATLQERLVEEIYVGEMVEGEELKILWTEWILINSGVAVRWDWASASTIGEEVDINSQVGIRLNERRIHWIRDEILLSLIERAVEQKGIREFLLIAISATESGDGLWLAMGLRRELSDGQKASIEAVLLCISALWADHVQVVQEIQRERARWRNMLSQARESLVEALSCIEGISVGDQPNTATVIYRIRDALQNIRANENCV